MNGKIPTGRILITANEAAAYGAMLARVQVIGAYPITPQTIIVERLAELSAGRPDIVFKNVESEHSMLGFVIPASRFGLRVFTATSCQGLLYAYEQVHRASRERVPVVMVNVNRSLVSPWSLQPDLADSTSTRDAGWVQLYCSSAQEVLDSVLAAYWLGETTLLPVMVCAEGFILSHTAEGVIVPSQEEVDAFLPLFSPPKDWLIDVENPRTFSSVPEPVLYSHFQKQVAEAMDQLPFLYEKVAKEFFEIFKRQKVAALEITGNRDASCALVTMGTIGDTAKELLATEKDLLLVRVHTYRPFPSTLLRTVLRNIPYVAVVDRAPAFGSFGPLGLDVRSLNLPYAEAVLNFICGLGGVDVTPATLKWILAFIREWGAVRGGAPIWVPEGV